MEATVSFTFHRIIDLPDELWDVESKWDLLEKALEVCQPVPDDAVDEPEITFITLQKGDDWVEWSY